MSVDSSPVKFTPARPDQPVPDIATISGGRPVFRAELPDGRIVWLVSGYETVRQMIIDQRFSRARAVAPGRAAPGFEMSAAESISGMDPPEHTRLRKLVASAFTVRRVGLRLAVPAGDLEFKPGMAIHSLRELPVRWDQP
jgi:cytochrome P450